MSANEVSPTMIDEARDILYSLNRTKLRCSLKLFNDELLNLFSVIPRAMKNVSDYLAKSCDDYDKIICREQKVLDVMAQQVGQYSSLSKRMKQVDGSEYGDPDHTILEAYGLDMRPCTMMRTKILNVFSHRNPLISLTVLSECIIKRQMRHLKNTVNGNILEKEIFISCIMDPVIRIGGELLRMDLC